MPQVKHEFNVEFFLFKEANIYFIYLFNEKPLYFFITYIT